MVNYINRGEDMTGYKKICLSLTAVTVLVQNVLVFSEDWKLKLPEVSGFKSKNAPNEKGGTNKIIFYII